MNGLTKRVCVVTAFSLGATAAAATQSPALAQDALHVIQSLVTCGTPTACVTGNNTGSGAGVAGISAKGNGVNGQTKASSYTSGAVYGNAVGKATGVYGVSNSGYGMIAKSASGNGLYATSAASSGIGLEGTGGGYGAYGYSSGGSGVQGSSSSGTGVIATSNSGFGLLAESSSNDAIHGYNYGAGTAVAAVAASGDALYAHTSSGYGAQISTNGGNGADISGTYIGIVGRAPAGSGTFPLALVDPSGHNLFYVDGLGDVFYHGTIKHFLNTTRGDVRAYGASSTTPSVEDVGSAGLRNGSTRVRLDPAFARSIDGSAYHVFLTPGGDTRGLFVAERDGDGFVVKEAQGGHASLTFDYRIVATATGHAADRISFASPNAVPHAPLSKVHENMVKPVKFAAPAILKP